METGRFGGKGGGGGGGGGGVGSFYIANTLDRTLCIYNDGNTIALPICPAMLCNIAHLNALHNTTNRTFARNPVLIL